MKNTILIFSLLILSTFVLQGCAEYKENKTAKLEQEQTEINQRNLNALQPAPKLSYSLERENLIKRFKLQNDRTIMFYMYVFIEGNNEPIGYYEVNKVSSVNSQLTNPSQIVYNGITNGGYSVLPSPAEDGSYGENGNGVFGFTPEEIYIEHNMKYICSTVPLSFKNVPMKLNVVSIESEKKLKEIMNKIK